MRGLLFSLVIVCPAALVAAPRTWTDASGNFRVEAELLRVTGTSVVLKTADGQTITVPLARLSENDRAFVRRSQSPAPAPTPLDSAVPNGSLASQARDILRRNCYRCHGRDGADEGGLNYIMNHDRLTAGHRYIIPGQPDKSLLFRRIVDGEMPEPGVTPRPSKGEIETLRRWIAAGAPDHNPAAERTFIDNHQVATAIQLDLERVPEQSRRFQRYFTLTHLYNAGASDDELQTYRLALAKLVNSLSWNREIVLPREVDAERTILCVDISHLNWGPELWDRIQEDNPYAFFPSAQHRKALKVAGCDHPYVRADWFVSVASRPPLYHDILQIPETEQELQRMLRVNVSRNIELERVVRCGFGRSGVSQNNRMIERHEVGIHKGPYWKSYDFAASSGRQNLFEFPLGPGTDRSSFSHDGGEIIFGLPNGLHGYMLTTADGSRIDFGPTNIVTDPRRPDRTVVNGISCMSCHYAGTIPKTDEIRRHVEANQAAFPDWETIQAIYPQQAEIDRVIREDGDRYVAALRALGMRRISRTAEPVSSTAERFEQDLDIKLASAEMGMQPAGMQRALRNHPKFARILGPLNVAGGTVKRDVFVQVFLQMVFELRIGMPLNNPGVSGPPPVNNTPLPADLKTIASDLRSSDSFKIRAAASKLRSTPPKQRFQELIDALYVAANSQDIFCRQEALKALAAVDPEYSLDRLLKALDDSHFMIRAQAFEMVGELRDRRTIPILARHLMGAERSRASTALSGFGPEAESEVLKYLQHRDAAVRSEACKVLGKVGTARSIDRLRRMLSDRGPFVSFSAKAAISEIDKRLRSAPPKKKFR